MSLPVRQIEFGSLLTYCPRRRTPEELESVKLMYALKNDEYVQTSSTTLLMSNWVASAIRTNLNSLPFGHFFSPNSTLVPVPKSSLITPETLWVPDRLARALVREGVGKDVATMLQRVTPIRKAARSDSWDRPTALEHFQTMGVIQTISPPEEVILVDDIVTRGATLLGAANRILDSYPDVRVRAFVAMRTQSNSFNFRNDKEARAGVITLQADGSTLRRP